MWTGGWSESHDDANSRFRNFPKAPKTSTLMLYKAEVAVNSQIHTKHINAMSASCRIFECSTWCSTKLPLGFKGVT